MLECILKVRTERTNGEIELVQRTISVQVVRTVLCMSTVYPLLTTGEGFKRRYQMRELCTTRPLTQVLSRSCQQSLRGAQTRAIKYERNMDDHTCHCRRW